MGLIHDDYVDKTDDHTLMSNAIRGMVGELDPHSAFMDQDEFEDLKIATEGNYSGIGVEVTAEDGVLTVIAPSAGSTNNAWLTYGAIGLNSAGDAAGENYSALSRIGHGNPTSNLESAWTTLSTGTKVTWIGAGSTNRAGVLIELVAATVAAGGGPPDTWHYRTRSQGAFFG